LTVADSLGEPIVVVPYDTAWPERYQRERDLILDAIGAQLVRIEHIGSTAVPGLGAKPVIDIIASLPTLQDHRQCVGPLRSLGYQHRGEAGIPGRQFFRKIDPDTGRRTCHLHLVAEADPFFDEHVLFRDFLHAHPAVADEYDRLKRTLATRFGNDRESYTNAKASFISTVLGNAGRWARQ